MRLYETSRKEKFIRCVFYTGEFLNESHMCIWQLLMRIFVALQLCVQKLRILIEDSDQNRTWRICPARATGRVTLRVTTLHSPIAWQVLAFCFLVQSRHNWRQLWWGYAASRVLNCCVRKFGNTVLLLCRGLFSYFRRTEMCFLRFGIKLQISGNKGL